MKYFYFMLICIFTGLCYINASAYTRIYLLSDIDMKNENLLISDICKMEGDNIDLISGLIISPDLYEDGIIENRELFNFLQPKLNGQMFIFGNGINIRKSLFKNQSVKNKIFFVKKGQIIGLLLRKNGIVIEMKGKALGSGTENDEINIRLSTGKIVKGKITGDKRADISI